MYPIIKIGDVHIAAYALCQLPALSVLVLLLRFQNRRFGTAFASQVAIVGITGLFIHFVIPQLSPLIPDVTNTAGNHYTTLAALASLTVSALLISVVYRTPLNQLLAPFPFAIAIAQAISRLGCLLAGCCYGTPTKSFMAITFSHPECPAPIGVALHPVQIYEIGVVMLIAVAIFLLQRNTKNRWLLVPFYVGSYSLVRFVLEYMRDADRSFAHGYLTFSQLVALLLLSSSILFVLLRVHRHKT